MIQFKRGSTESWKKLKKPLAAGQPGYDKDKHKMKIGDGESAWTDLPDSSGLRMEEILISEKDAKDRVKGILKPLDLLRKMLKLADRPIITYGEETPNKDTLGQLYLQYYDAEPEVDYVVEYGIDGIWTYRKWHSGRAECFGTLEVSTTVQAAIGNLYSDDKAMKNTSYPFTFASRPHEVASLQSPGGIVWLAGRSENTTEYTALYSILSTDNQANQATYKIGLSVAGYWR